MDNTHQIAEEAIELAGKWQDRANELRTRRETARQHKFARLFESSTDKIILTKLIDQCFRCADNRRTADQIHYLLAEYGIPGFFSSLEKTLMEGFNYAGRFVPGITVPAVIEKMRQDSGHLIIPGEADAMNAFLQKRKDQGLRVNINYLGEEVLGEQEALSRLNMYLTALKNPAIEYISVKISTIFSQIQALAFEHTVDMLKKRLTELYRSAALHQFVRQDGSQVNKFVNLDMESYRDLAITYQAFIRTLEQDELKDHHAGMALQAYLPDSYDILQQITHWARKRVTAGGSPIKIRIVKGANLEMEKIESAIFDWPLAPFDNKLEVDANWKRMVDFGMQPDNIRAVRLGIASHNLFDLAYAYLLARKNKVSDFFSFEMIEGMANHVRRAIQETGQEMVLYAPVAARDQFINAISYLIRRLDENTGEKNFLRQLNLLDTNSGAWQFLADHFKASLQQKDQPAKPPYRNQNRLTEKFPQAMGTFYRGEFKNEPNTDWSLSANRDWAEKIRQKWKKSPEENPIEIPLVVAAKKYFSGRKIREAFDPSQFNSKVMVARTAMADAGDIDKAVATATADPDGWRRMTLRQHHRILARVATELRRSRGDLIGAAAANTGKVFTEADVEVSEAIDFAEYYPFSTEAFSDSDHLRCRGKGVGVVISPWNFPIAIPCGGITAALAAGNTVIFKPSSESTLVAWVLCQCFWRAGISQHILQFVPCAGSTTASRLTNHPEVDFIILTGGTQTGLSILRQRPDVLLAAETGGKNATIVTAMSDRDQAIGNVIYSAFGNSGQKCSATSLLILEPEVYEDAKFKQQLVDAARSISTGSAWNFYNIMGPLVQPPQGDLLKALTELEPGETWALRPQNIDDNPFMWTPGIKWDVRPQSDTHMTEFFGPLLGVMRADNLDHAIELVNQTGYGLTSGLESLDPREVDHWQERIKAGNLYINRGTTGAVTLRQPFGGMGKSALGGAMKAGGPKYTAQFMDFEAVGPPTDDAAQKPHPLLTLSRRWQQQLVEGEFQGIESDIENTIGAIQSYLVQTEREFSRRLDYFQLRGQDNILRYLPVGTVVIRLHEDDCLFETLARIAAVIVSGCKLRISIPEELDTRVTRFLDTKDGRRLIGRNPVVYELDKGLIKSLPIIDRIRYAAPDRVPRDVQRAAAEIGFYIARTPVMMDGRIELLQYYRPQSICNNFHRYGNLGERAPEFE
jgi:RHH-type transcriptional regulator, proline utilization regulon repressor / proline dehydrogenase / delta 1-pyrroline-5-carboxylate dehydrogenase